MPRTIPAETAALIRRSLIVRGTAPSPLIRRIRWMALRHHRANSPDQPTPTGGAAMPVPKRAA